MTYAKNTTVSPQQTRNDIEMTLRRYGATEFIYGWEPSQAVVQFKAENRIIRFILAMPDRYAREFTHTPERRTERSHDAAEKAWEQATKQRWRALLLVIKAKLEAVESGITTFEKEFLAHIVLPTGETVGDWITPQIEYSYEHYDMPKMLPTGEK